MDATMLSGEPRAQDVDRYLAEKAPPVYDPFCGGGSIPLEAQRLGLRAIASDLNPVAVLITKALIEIPPKFAGRPPVNPESRRNAELKTWKGAQGLAEDVRYYGKWMRDEAEKRIGHLYPKVTVTAEMAAGREDLKRYVGRELTVILEPDGTPMTVRTALGLINQVLDEVLAAEESEYDADTRWAITWFTQHGFDAAPYGDAETLSKARNTSVEGLVKAGILEARGGKVRLLRRDELGDTWDPSADVRFTVWEACQHLIKALETGGEAAAAELLRRLGASASPARELAYRLYQHCERTQQAEEARSYNGLVVAWPRLAALASERAAAVETLRLDFGG